MYVCMCMHIMYVRMYACICMYVTVCMYVCMYVGSLLGVLSHAPGVASFGTCEVLTRNSKILNLSTLKSLSA